MTGQRRELSFVDRLQLETAETRLSEAIDLMPVSLIDSALHGKLLDAAAHLAILRQADNERRGQPRVP
jgi:hypothetical protein